MHTKNTRHVRQEGLALHLTRHTCRHNTPTGSCTLLYPSPAPPPATQSADRPPANHPPHPTQHPPPVPPPSSCAQESPPTPQTHRSKHPEGPAYQNRASPQVQKSAAPAMRARKKRRARLASRALGTAEAARQRRWRCKNDRGFDPGVRNGALRRRQQDASCAARTVLSHVRSCRNAPCRAVPRGTQRASLIVVLMLMGQRHPEPSAVYVCDTRKCSGCGTHPRARWAWARGMHASPAYRCRDYRRALGWASRGDGARRFGMLGHRVVCDAATGSPHQCPGVRKDAPTYIDTDDKAPVAVKNARKQTSRSQVRRGWTRGPSFVGFGVHIAVGLHKREGGYMKSYHTVRHASACHHMLARRNPHARGPAPHATGMGKGGAASPAVMDSGLCIFKALQLGLSHQPSGE